jgi:hypothetical protein
MEIMWFMGFPNIWLNWLSAILSTASTKVLLNGTPGEKICHIRGFCLGDPLSLILFLLVMVVLSAMICQGDAWSIFALLGAHPYPIVHPYMWMT